MFFQAGNRQHSGLRKNSILVVLCLVATILLVISLVASKSLAQQRYKGFQYADNPETNYGLSKPISSVKQDNYTTHTKHFDTHFRLLTRQLENHLEVAILLPPTYEEKYSEENFNDDDNPNQTTSITAAVIDALSEAKKAVSFQFSGDFAILYNTVADRTDCRNQLFVGNYSMGFKQSSQFLQIPLSASDYGRYYCFRVRLQIEKQGFDSISHKIFITKNPISHISSNSAKTNLKQTIVRDTYYDYTFNRLQWTRPNQERTNYYRHLNDNFKLHAFQTNQQLKLEVTLPGKLALAGRTDIKHFKLESLTYIAVNQPTECTRSAFKKETLDVINNPPLRLNLIPAKQSYGLYYCFKLSLKGVRNWAFDKHPYRIFLLPERINSQSTTPDDIWQVL